MTDRDSARGSLAGRIVAGAPFGEGGRYTLTRLLGTGGMASVWAAADSRLGREVAIKIISDALALDPAFVDRFEREARMVASLSHPHVVQVYDYSAHGDRPYLVMEYVAGGTLSGRLKDQSADWNPVTLARELLEALAYIHAAGVLHRDLKPANVLIGADGRARLTDFGIAQLADATRLTSTGLVVGTQQYLAPEILAGHPADARTDLYSCGVLLGECAGPDVPLPLRSLLAQLTDPDPDQRPQTSSAALAQLAEASRAGPPTEQMTAPTRPMQAPMQAEAAPAQTRALTMPAHQPAPSPAARSVGPMRRPRVIAGAAALVVVLLVAGGLALSGGGGEPDPLTPPPDGATLTQQLDQLDDAIDRARR